MKKKDIEKMAYDNPNDFELGEKIRQIVNDSEIEVQVDEEPDWKDMYLRLSAEFDNYRKRIQKEKEDLTIRVKSSMIESILDLDNDLSIATKYSKDEGVKLIISKIDNILKSHGIEAIQTNEYDDNIHEVVSILPIQNPAHKKGSIVDVVSKGYTLNNKIIRYPKIIIYK
jgi:molecular chaperone GrpE